MAIERKWEAVASQNLTADGTTDGVLTIANAGAFKVGQIIQLGSAAQPTVSFKVKRIPNGTTLQVGPDKTNINERSDVSAYLAADAAFVRALEQNRPNIAPDDVDRATYEEEPTVARRIIPVDILGRPVTEDNPLPVTGDFAANFEAGPKEQLNAFLGNLDSFEKVEQETISGTVYYNVYQAGARVLRLKQTTTAGGFCLEVEFAKILQENDFVLLQENGDALLKENLNGG